MRLAEDQLHIDEVCPLGYRPESILVTARIGRRRYDFAWLGPQHQVEVYDYPRTWRGVPRFVGHMPWESGAKFLAITRRWSTR